MSPRDGDPVVELFLFIFYHSQVCSSVEKWNIYTPVSLPACNRGLRAHGLFFRYIFEWERRRRSPSCDIHFDEDGNGRCFRSRPSPCVYMYYVLHTLDGVPNDGGGGGVLRVSLNTTTPQILGWSGKRVEISILPHRHGDDDDDDDDDPTSLELSPHRQTRTTDDGRRTPQSKMCMVHT